MIYSNLLGCSLLTDRKTKLWKRLQRIQREKNIEYPWYKKRLFSDAIEFLKITKLPIFVLVLSKKPWIWTLLLLILRDRVKWINKWRSNKVKHNKFFDFELIVFDCKHWNGKHQKRIDEGGKNSKASSNEKSTEPSWNWKPCDNPHEFAIDGFLFGLNITHWECLCNIKWSQQKRNQKTAHVRSS